MLQYHQYVPWADEYHCDCECGDATWQRQEAVEERCLTQTVMMTQLNVGNQRQAAVHSTRATPVAAQVKAAQLERRA
jgi:hypothetical protein